MAAAAICTPIAATLPGILTPIHKDDPHSQVFLGVSGPKWPFLSSEVPANLSASFQSYNRLPTIDSQTDALKKNTSAAPAGDREIPPEFVDEFSGYIAENNLHDLFSLQVIHPRKNVERRVEIEAGWNKAVDFTCLHVGSLTQAMLTRLRMASTTKPVVVGPKKGAHKVIVNSPLPPTEENVMQKLAQVEITKI
ncbi:hypothetical protein MKZ38_001197 [Zalerion maritima]|uniref:Uncharacterized protein n=1 Tax=Zalerion maritima TaxID=339359 RepID=A0AAD5WXJ8_9PEZI|nr:hypothetical protein MKZ38_001197 [Zalerion maritima]